MQNNLYLLILTFLLSACGQSSKEACRFGAPQAIFSVDLPGVEKHHFEQSGQQATEEILFTNQLALKLYQSGCNSIKQEFRFQMPGDFRKEQPDFWINKSVALFQYLASLSDKQVSFFQWAQVIEESRYLLKLGQLTEIQPQIFVRIDQIPGPDMAILQIELSQGASEKAN